MNHGAVKMSHNHVVVVVVVVVEAAVGVFVQVVSIRRDNRKVGKSKTGCQRYRSYGPYLIVLWTLTQFKILWDSFEYWKKCNLSRVTISVANGFGSILLA